MELPPLLFEGACQTHIEPSGMLRWACIAPHGGDILEELAESSATMAATRSAMEELGRRALEHAPETVIVMTPHGHHVRGRISISITDRCAGSLDGAKGNAVSVDADVDVELGIEIGKALVAMDIPVAWMAADENGERAQTLPMDWGALIPFWYLGAQWPKPPLVVVLCPCPSITPLELVTAGEVLREVVNSVGRKSILVASADQGHGHHADGPYGYTPASAEHDGKYTRAIAENRLADLLTWNLADVDAALTDSYPQTIILHGAMGGPAKSAELLSYEAPTYFGMAVAAFEVPWELPA